MLTYAYNISLQENSLLMIIWDDDLTPEQIASKLAHSVLSDNTVRIQDRVTQKEKEGLITMQQALDIMQAWHHLVSRMGD